MMVQHLKRRPLSRYLKDFKHSQTHCAHCRKLLDRITLVRDGKIVNKIEISRLDMLFDENGWQVEQKSWAAWGCGRFPGLLYHSSPHCWRYILGLTAPSDNFIRRSLYHLM